MAMPYQSIEVAAGKSCNLMSNSPGNPMFDESTGNQSTVENSRSICGQAILANLRSIGNVRDSEPSESSKSPASSEAFSSQRAIYRLKHRARIRFGVQAMGIGERRAGKSHVTYLQRVRKKRTQHSSAPPWRKKANKTARCVDKTKPQAPELSKISIEMNGVLRGTFRVHTESDSASRSNQPEVFPEATASRWSSHNSKINLPTNSPTANRCAV